MVRRHGRNFSYEENTYEKLLTLQNGKCAICSIETSVLCMDHNHISNKLRGLLCNRCNLAIGLMNEDTARLKEAIKYLTAYSEV